MQEERFSGKLYAGGVLKLYGSPITPPITPRAEEFFCTINYNWVEGGEAVVDSVSLRQRIKKKVHKGEDKAF